MGLVQEAPVIETGRDMATDIREMTNVQLIGSCIWLDREQKQGRGMLNRYKAELQTRGLKEMEERNTRYVKYFGEEGTAAIMDSMSLDILNPDKLRECIGEGVFRMKIKENVKTEYKCDARLERALKALFTGEYTFEFTMKEFLEEQIIVKPTPEQVSLLIRKLKGDPEKDREALSSVLSLTPEQERDIEVELLYICRIKNAELIRAFIPKEGIDATIAAIRECILVETKTAITIDYEEKKEDGHDSSK